MLVIEILLVGFSQMLIALIYSDPTIIFMSFKCEEERKVAGKGGRIRTVLPYFRLHNLPVLSLPTYSQQHFVAGFIYSFEKIYIYIREN